MDKARLFRKAHKMTKAAIAKFGKNDIVKETAKSYQVKLHALTNDAVTRLIWVPKSCVAY